MHERVGKSEFKHKNVSSTRISDMNLIFPHKTKIK
jgi:hypothetical protein